MTSSGPSGPVLPLWAPLTAVAVGSVLFAAAQPGVRTWCAVAAAVLGTVATAVYCSEQTAASRPCAAIAWMAAAVVGGVLSWGLGRDTYPYEVVCVQLLVGVALLPGHVRRSARSR